MDLLEFLKMKIIIKRYESELNWKLTRWGGMDDTKDKYAVSLDNGNQTYHRIYFDKCKYDTDYILFICRELSEILNISCDVVFK